MKLFPVILVYAICCLPTSHAQTTLEFSSIENSVNSGISLLVLKEAYAELGISVKNLPLPGERALRTSNAGQADGELFRIKNVDKRYQNLLMVPTPINVLQAIAFSKAHDFTINGWDSLKPYHLGIQVGIKFAERGTQGMQPTTVDSNHQLFKMLDSQRVDIVVAAYSNGLQTIKKLKLNSIISLQPPIQEYPLYHYLHKKHRALVPKIDQVLKKMHESGRTQQIREGYLKTFLSDMDK